jgi:hypothetical protein
VVKGKEPEAVDPRLDLWNHSPTGIEWELRRLETGTDREHLAVALYQRFQIQVCLPLHSFIYQQVNVEFGKPYNGLRLIGYNSATEQYEASWAYSMSSAIMTMGGATVRGRASRRLAPASRTG